MITHYFIIDNNPYCQQFSLFLHLIIIIFSMRLKLTFKTIERIENRPNL